MKSLLIVAVWFSHKSHYFLLTYRVFLSANQNSEFRMQHQNEKETIRLKNLFKL